MDLRKKELVELKTFTQNVETEVTMLLQSLQWDRKRLLEGTSSAICRYDANHRMPTESLEAHESNCVLRSLGYTESDELLPDPPDDGAHTLVKFSNNQIQQIINEATINDPLFKKGGVSHQPLSLSRLQLVYTADERRALHDAVVAAVPSCHDLGDLALASSNEDNKQGSAVKSRVEILAELRNMKRRRTKYRVAAKTKNYSDVLRDVIKTQMESYSEAVSATFPTKTDANIQSRGRDVDKTQSKNNFSINKYGKYKSLNSRDNNETRHENTGKRAYNAHYDENRHKKDIQKESSSKKYENPYSRADSSKKQDSHREKDKNRDREYSAEKSYERLKPGNEHNESRSHRSSHKHKRRSHEENTYRRDITSTDKRRYKLDKKKTYDYEDRYSEGRHYKEDRHEREEEEEIKEEPKDRSRESRSKHSHQSDSKRNERSRSRDRHRDSRKRKHRGDDRQYVEKNEEIHYKRYYDVKKEES